MSVTITEAQLQDTIVLAARTLGYLAYHTIDARLNEPGFPDLIIVGFGQMVVWEVKTAKGRLRPASVTKKGRWLPGQQDWLDAFAEAGIPQGVIRPGDLDDALTLLNQWRDDAINREERKSA
jgi:hypothetical protein